MKHWKWILKILITAGLLCWVGSGIDRERFAEAIDRADKTLLVAAIIPYLFSRVTAASRLTTMLNAQEVPLSQGAGLHLHWTSMFYGMFLPGGLGGDAYKLLRLRQYFPGQKTMLLTKTLLWDRIIGFAALALLAGTLVAMRLYDRSLLWGIAGLAVVSAGTFWFAATRFLHTVFPVLGRLMVLSVLTQVCQIVCMAILLQVVGAKGHLADYVLIFLLSSIAAMFPLSIGGIGARELVFLKGAQLLGTSENVAVTVSVLFDIIVMLTAITGAFLTDRRRVKTTSGEPTLQ
nr:lysylphosphatidylglycerol synthase transmembrane domain-containing protein [uncultured Dyadobacter sp.]